MAGVCETRVASSRAGIQTEPLPPVLFLWGWSELPALLIRLTARGAESTPPTPGDEWVDSPRRRKRGGKKAADRREPSISGWKHTSWLRPSKDNPEPQTTATQEQLWEFRTF